MALRDLPGAPEGTISRPAADGALAYEPVEGEVVRPGSATLLPFGFDPEWPDAVGLRIAVADGDGPPRWDAGRRLLTVELRKGALFRVPVSCYVEREDLELMAVWDWMRAFVDEANMPARAFPRFADGVATAVQLSLEGGHWMLTPPRELVLVSASANPSAGRSSAPSRRDASPARRRPHSSASCGPTGRPRLASSFFRVDRAGRPRRHASRRLLARPRGALHRGRDRAGAERSARRR